MKKIDIAFLNTDSNGNRIKINGKTAVAPVDVVEKTIPELGLTLEGHDVTLAEEEFLGIAIDEAGLYSLTFYLEIPEGESISDNINEMKEASDNGKLVMKDIIIEEIKTKNSYTLYKVDCVLEVGE